MAFLDNSGDIVLDAVLTTAGRRRLAEGAGAFKVARFALSDDEIDYALYNSSHASGSAYFDLDILKSPVLEAVTEPNAALKYKLLTIPNQQLLFLPTLKLNTKQAPLSALNTIIVAVNDKVVESLTGGTTLPNYDTIFNGVNGYIDGRAAAKAAGTLMLKIGQGFDTAEAGGAGTAMPTDLEETQFAIAMDARFGHVVTNTPEGGVEADLSFISTDGTGVWALADGANPDNFEAKPVAEKINIAGPIGRQLKFSIKGASSMLNNAQFFFDKYGRSDSNFNSTSVSLKKISANLRIQGLTQGGVVNIPLHFIAEF